MTTQLSVVDRAIRKLAQTINVDPSSIQTADPIGGDPIAASLLKVGSLNHLHIQRWRAKDTVSHKDMGVEPANEEEKKAWARVFKDLGTKRLLPEEQMTRDDRIESAARSLHESYTLKTFMGRFMVMGAAECGQCGAKNLPESRFEHLTEMHADWLAFNYPETDWQALLDNFRSDEPDAVKLAKELIAPIADTSAGKESGWGYDEWLEKVTALQASYFKSRDELCEPSTWQMYQDVLAGSYAVIGFENYGRLLATGAKNLPDDRDEFVRDFVKRAMRNVPTREQVYDSYVFRWELQFVPLASELAGDQTLAAIQQAEKQAALELARARNRMEIALIETKRQTALESWGKVVADLQEDIRAFTYDQCLNALKALDKPENRGSLPSQSIVMIRNLFDRINALNFWDDDDLKEQIAAVRQMVELPKSIRDEMPVRSLLEQMAVDSALVLLSIDRGASRSGVEWGLPAPDDIQGLVGFARARRDSAWGDVEIEQADLGFGTGQTRGSADALENALAAIS